MTRSLTIALLCFLHAGFTAQKYNFVNWTVEDGLIQSQALAICQDDYRQLWVGTEGGVSCFDGRKFRNYTVTEGLPANHVNALATDRKGRIYIGTSNGVAVFDGRKFTRLSLPQNVRNVSTVIPRGDSVLCLDAFSRLYAVRSGACRVLCVSGDSSEKVSAVYSCGAGVLAAVIGKGIWALEEGGWRNIYSVYSAPRWFVRRIFISSYGDTIIAPGTGLSRLSGGRLTAVASASTVLSAVLSIAEDAQHNLWLGTENGAIRLGDGKATRFNGTNGLTDNAVNGIFLDSGSNLWFATDAEGIFKFNENTFTYYDKTAGLSNPIVMGVVQAPSGKVYAAGYGGGLFVVDSTGKLSQEMFNGPVLPDCKINCLYADGRGDIWIGTLGRGVYRYTPGRRLQLLDPSREEGLLARGATCFLQIPGGDMLIGSNQCVFVCTKDEALRNVPVPAGLVTSLKPFGMDSVIAATASGLFAIDKSYAVTPFYKNIFGRLSILCLSVKGRQIWLGTTDRGLFKWTGDSSLVNIASSDGLPNNFIYSVHASDPYHCWVGTGFGICHISLNGRNKVAAIKQYGRSEGLLGMECSHNCLLQARDSSLWFGTTRGLFHFRPGAGSRSVERPVVLLRNVLLFSADIRDSSFFAGKNGWFGIPAGLKLPSGRNHLTFELGSVFFSNPDDILYQYKLEGADQNFTRSSNPLIIYPSLPPGRYRLIAKAITRSGAISDNAIVYAFEIEKAFYQTRWFQVLLVILLLCLGGLITYVLTRGRQKRKQRAKEQLSRIREEEFVKLRQRTAEDFHDEMGNSLTRISLLADILKTRVNGREAEVTKLVDQIRENTTALYSGSRDIIWSLNASNDRLYEIAGHLRDIGSALFQDTPVEFTFSHNIQPDDPARLKLDYSRNLTMIFKEVYNNILKHSAATEVRVSLSQSDGRLKAVITDNGRGYSGDVKKGNGILNMHNRVARMHGALQIESGTTGTAVTVVISDVFYNERHE